MCGGGGGWSGGWERELGGAASRKETNSSPWLPLLLECSKSIIFLEEKQLPARILDENRDDGNDDDDDESFLSL